MEPGLQQIRTLSNSGDAKNISLGQLRTYLKSLAEGHVPLYEAKLMLVGEGNVGKTTLVEALAGRPFVENRETTHGIRIGSLRNRDQSEGRDVVLRSWDFGGQRVYRATHQSFFTGRSVYLVVWHPREGVEENNVEHWLNLIRLRLGSEARVHVVATHAETGKRVPRIDQRRLGEEYGKIIRGFHEVDSATGYGVQELRSAILETAASLPQMGMPLSPQWKQVMDLLGAKEEARIAFVEFAKMCEEKEVDEHSLPVLSKLLHDLGHVIHYADDEALRREMILQPEWLTKAIGFVLEDRPTNERDGVLLHADLQRIWHDSPLEEGAQYASRYHPYFLRLMEKFDVSYRLDERHSLVPQLLPNERPQLPKQAGHKLRVVCVMSQAPLGLMPWTIVRTHMYSAGVQWQHGVSLQYQGHIARMEHLDRELTVQVEGPYPAHFMTILIDTVDRLIDERWRGLDYHFSVPCPTEDSSCQGRFGLEALRVAKSEGDEFYRCQRCHKKIEIDERLFGVRSRTGTIEDVLSELQQKLDQALVEREAMVGYVGELTRLVLNGLASETSECPRLFTLAPTEKKRLTARNLGKLPYQLDLYCEFPGEEHSCFSETGKGRYKVQLSEDWLKRVAPFASLIGRTLQRIIPLSAALLEDYGAPNVAESKFPLKFMTALPEVWLKGALDVPEKGRPREGPSGVSRVEGEGLRELHSLLVELDPTREWGGLRRVVAASGDFLWVCPRHHRVYEPELPTLSE